MYSHFEEDSLPSIFYRMLVGKIYALHSTILKLTLLWRENEEEKLEEEMKKIEDSDAGGSLTYYVSLLHFIE
jgi:hypothetical protein